MQNSSSKTRRQSWLTAYRIFTVAALAVVVAMLTILLGRSFAPITSVQATKVERATTYLQDIGFKDPVYLGITPATEGEYPTFRVTAIGGAKADVFIRTNPDGGWEFQLGREYVLNPMGSADDLARAAYEAVSDWEKMPSTIQPRTDGSWGEYESRKYAYERLKPYNPDPSYWRIPRDETGGWPKK